MEQFQGMYTVIQGRCFDWEVECAGDHALQGRRFDFIADQVFEHGRTAWNERFLQQVGHIGQCFKAAREKQSLAAPQALQNGFAKADLLGVVLDIDQIHQSTTLAPPRSARQICTKPLSFLR